MARLALVVALVGLVVLLIGCGDSTDTSSSDPTTAAAPTTAADTTASTTTPVSTTTSTESKTSTTLAPVSYPGGATYVTGRIADFTIDEGTVSTNADGTSQSRDGTITYTLISNDARVTGTVTGTWNSDRWGTQANGAIIQWGEATITNENGTWEAPYNGIWTSTLGDVLTRWWQGSGDYAGLTFYMAASGEWNWEWVGFIYPGTPPPEA